MRNIQRLIFISIISISIVVLGCVSAGLAETQTDKELHSQSLFRLKPEITSEIPHNPDLAKQQALYPNTSRVAFIDNFAWQVFLALNWPADCQQGATLEDKKIGEVPDAPRIWEFYRTPETIFLSAGKEPSTQPTKPFTCLNVTSARGLQTEDSSLQLTESEKLDGNEKGTNENKPLVDQQGNYIIMESYINPQEFNQIVENKWYDAVNLQQFNNEDKKFALVCSEDANANPLNVPCSTYEKEGAIEIKAAWRVFDPQTSNEEKARYYTTKRQRTIPAQSNECAKGKALCSDTGQEFTQIVEVGLIGFHIKQKTSEQGWIWSTFEQVDNVPDNSSNRARYTLYNPDCSENCIENKPYVEKPYLWRQEAPHAVKKVGDTIENQIPSQITRLPNSSLNSHRLEQNKHWQEALKDISQSSVWQYYQLIGTQWLTNPSLPYNKSLRDVTPKSSLANVSIEPYIPNSSCIECHTGAKLRASKQLYVDFSFPMGRANSSNSSATNAQ
ncbi:hypothetical protein WA1_21425 [Scytonema hofmannii PCC 7110]|uniref:Uncharacterized protein n=1 Tax=Scytonema hofmannii PCC 7110 TaxID=128403 RepID=A0A139XCZ2_9CYAN|nr:hypothetical protein [Scytonema hofmannii]KYC42523.1 hypothetical protein WA1_21425 [Scytonema hofmannii PCC 7110]